MRLKMPMAGSGTHADPGRVKYEFETGIQTHLVYSGGLPSHCMVTVSDEEGKAILADKENYPDVEFYSDETPKQALDRVGASEMSRKAYWDRVSPKPVEEVVEETEEEVVEEEPEEPEEEVE